MNKIIFTSDLHVRHRTDATFLNFIDKIHEKVDPNSIDAVIIGGDLADYRNGVQESLATLTTKFPSSIIGYVPGNHDVWHRYWNRHCTTDYIFYSEIPKICKSLGVKYLEQENISLGNWLLCGTVAWYDYSAKREGPSHIQLLPDEYYAANKAGHNADDHYVKFSKSDIEMAQECASELLKRLQMGDTEEIDHVGVFTHVPLFSEAIQWRSYDNNWNLGCPYFYHLTLGDQLLKEEKVRLVASGHTHYGLESTQIGANGQDVTHLVCYADYGRPSAFEIDLLADGSTVYNLIK